MCGVCECCKPIAPKWGPLLLLWVCLLVQNSSRLDALGNAEGWLVGSHSKLHFSGVWTLPLSFTAAAE